MPSRNIRRVLPYLFLAPPVFATYHDCNPHVTKGQSTIEKLIFWTVCWPITSVVCLGKLHELYRIYSGEEEKEITKRMIAQVEWRQKYSGGK